MTTMTRFARPLRAVLSGCVLTCTLFAAPLAVAAGVAPMDATPDQKKQAVDLFTSGKEAVAKNEFDAGIDQLRRSLDIVDSPNTRLILSRALRDAGKTGEAWEEYGRTITSAKALAAREPKYAAAADAAGSERSDLEGKLAFVVVNISHGGNGTVLKVGGNTIPPEEQSGPIPVAPGSVDILVEQNGAAVARKTVTAPLGQKTPVAIDAASRGGPVAPVDTGKDPLTTPDEADSSGVRPAPERPAASRSSGSTLRTLSYVAGGIGIAGLGTFAVAGLLSNSSYNDLQSSCNPGCPASKSSEISSGKTEQTIANIGLGVGAVGLVTGVTLFLVSRSSPSKPSSGDASLVLGPAYIGVRGSL